MTILQSAPPLPPPPETLEEGSWSLLLDVDGTLLDYASAPDRVRVPPELPSTLRALAVRCDHALALLSGRSLGSLSTLFGDLDIDMVGLHGLEGRYRDGRRWSEATLTPESLSPLRQELTRLTRGETLFLEDKGSCLALHAEEVILSRLRPRIEEILTAWPALTLLTGHRILELRPREARKERAASRLLGQPPYKGRRPIFLGDDITDEETLALVRALGGLAIVVGNRRTDAATHRLTGPAEARRWLARLARRVSHHDRPRRLGS